MPNMPSSVICSPAGPRWQVSSSLGSGVETPWLGLTGSLAQIPGQRHAEQTFGDRLPRLLLEDLESLGRVVTAGLGVAVLPSAFARRLPGVVEVNPVQLGLSSVPLRERDVWMVVHRSKQRVPKIRAVMTWLQSLSWE